MYVTIQAMVFFFQNFRCQRVGRKIIKVVKSKREIKKRT